MQSQHLTSEDALPLILSERKKCVLPNNVSQPLRGPVLVTTYSYAFLATEASSYQIWQCEFYEWRKILTDLLLYIQGRSYWNTFLVGLVGLVGQVGRKSDQPPTNQKTHSYRNTRLFGLVLNLDRMIVISTDLSSCVIDASHALKILRGCMYVNFKHVYEYIAVYSILLFWTLGESASACATS